MSNYIEMSKAFPEFDQSTLPAIPADWRESSWHNDACPSFLVFDNGNDAFVQVFIDFEEKHAREFGGNGGRFSVLLSTESKTESFDSDDWTAVLSKVSEFVDYAKSN